MKFRPKYSFFILLLAFTPTYLFIITYFCEKVLLEFAIPQYIMIAALQITALLTYFGFRYELTRDELIISGLFYHHVIPLELIFKAELVIDFSIAPASSPKRIKLFYDKTKTIEISPKFRTIFITELTNRHPSIVVRMGETKKKNKKLFSLSNK